MDTPYKEIARLLADRGISAVPVVDDEGRMLGVVSEADLMTKASHQDSRKEAVLFAGDRERDLESKATGMTAGELMTSPPITIGPDADVVHAARMMEDQRVKRLPVTDGHGHLLGLGTLTRHARSRRSRSSAGPAMASKFGRGAVPQFAEL